MDRYPRPVPPIQSRPRRNRRARALLVAIEIGLLASFLVGSAVALGWSDADAERFDRGVIVAGQDIGGLDREDARARLAEALAVPEQLTFIADGSRAFDLDLTLISYGYDTDQLLDEAFVYGHGKEPAARLYDRWGMLLGRRPIEAHLSYDEHALRQQLERIVISFEREPVDAQLIIDSEGLRTTASRTGLRVDERELARLAKLALVRAEPDQMSIVVPQQSVAVEIGEEASAAAARRAGAMSDQALKLRFAGDEDWRQKVSPRQLRAWLAIEPAIGGYRVLPATEEIEMSLMKLASELAREPREARVQFVEGQYEVVRGEVGLALDIQAARQAIVMALDDRHDGETIDILTLPAIESPPSFTTAMAESAASAMRQMSSPLVLHIGEEDELLLDSAQLSALLNIELIGPEQLQPLVRPKRLTELANEIASRFERPTTEAGLAFDGDEVVLVPGVDGLHIDAEQLSSLLAERLNRRATAPDYGPLSVAMTITSDDDGRAAQLAEWASQMEMVSSWTTGFRPGPVNFEGRNITLPAEKLHGQLIMPGQAFDFMDAVGEISEAAGYGRGGAIINGKPQPEGAIGGGICTTSTTIFNAALHLGLPIDKRFAHSYYIGRYPVGLDATVFENAWTRKTMRFTNDTDFPILIRAFSTRKSVTFELYSRPNGRTVVISEPEISELDPATFEIQTSDELEAGLERWLQEPHDGMRVIASRQVYDAAGAEMYTDVFKSNYIRVDGIQLVGR